MMTSLPLPKPGFQRRQSYTARRISMPLANPRSTRLVYGCFLVLAAYLLMASHHYDFDLGSLHDRALSYLQTDSPTDQAIAVLTSSLATTPEWNPADHHALIYNWCPWHEDVWLYLAGTLAKMGVNVDTFTENDDEHEPWRKANNGGVTGVRFNLLEIANQTGMLPKPLKEKKAFLNAVNTPDANGKYADVVFFGTEIQDMQSMAFPLLEKWHQRPADQKFRLVPIYHEVSQELRTHAPQWAKLGALTYLTISQHVADALEVRLHQLARHQDMGRSGMDKVKVKVAVPYLPVQQLVVPSNASGAEQRETHSKLAQAVVAGKLEWGRRDYWGILNDLKRHLQYDAAAWGYVWDPAQAAWARIDKSNTDTFRILLAGEHSNVGFENMHEFRNIVDIHKGDSQYTFYEQMATTDVLLRAWYLDSKYYETQCSGSVVRSIETATPMLVTSELLGQYTFLDKHTALVRPEGISDIDAIALYRRFPDAAQFGVDDTELLEVLTDYELVDAHTNHFSEIKAMLEMGWRRSVENYDTRRAHVDTLSQQALKEAILGI